MAKKSDNSRIPSPVGATPVVGDLMRSADSQARWMQEMLEQNARLVSQFPATMKTFNDSIERFNQTVGRLDRAVTRLEAAGKNLTGPMDKLLAALDPKTVRELPQILEALRALGELPGAGMVRRRIMAGRGEEESGRPKPG